MFSQCAKCKVRPPAVGQLCRSCAGVPPNVAVSAPAPVAAALVPAPSPATPTEADVADALAAIEHAATTQQPSHGLGDKIAKVAKALGFEQTPGCGCQKRQANLNYINFNQSPIAVAKDMWNALRVKREGKI